MKKAPERPITLSGNVLRGQQSHRNSDPSFVRAWRTLDEVGDTFDALVGLYSNPSPDRTVESHALKYKDAHQKARDRMLKRVEDALLDLDAVRQSRRREAEIKAGLHSPVSDTVAAEIRATLRQMTPDDRNRAIREAALSGDAAVVNAVRSAPTSMLTGGHTVPLDEIVEQMVLQADPELQQVNDDVDMASSLLAGGMKQFNKLTAEIRDPLAEARGEAQREAIRRAEAKLTEPSDG